MEIKLLLVKRLLLFLVLARNSIKFKNDQYRLSVKIENEIQ